MLVVGIMKIIKLVNQEHVWTWMAENGYDKQDIPKVKAGPLTPHFCGSRL